MVCLARLATPTSEAQRQRELLTALRTGTASARVALRECGERAARGLEAYRANAESIAERALASTFVTVQTMLGRSDFKHLACEFWRAHPPERGDLAEWGGALPAWLAGHRKLTAWPWLADTARLDFAVHGAERAKDGVLDAHSLSQLESADPAQLRLVLMPGTGVLDSPWPIVSIHRAHQLAGEAGERAFAEVRAGLAAQRGEHALIARRGWRAIVYPLDAASAAWTRDLLDGFDLAAALKRAGEGFDFTAWLGTALREAWLQGVAACDN